MKASPEEIFHHGLGTALVPQSNTYLPKVTTWNTIHTAAGVRGSMWHNWFGCQGCYFFGLHTTGIKILTAVVYLQSYLEESLSPYINRKISFGRTQPQSETMMKYRWFKYNVQRAANDSEGSEVISNIPSLEVGEKIFLSHAQLRETSLSAAQFPSSIVDNLWKAFWVSVSNHAWSWPGSLLSPLSLLFPNYGLLQSSSQVQDVIIGWLLRLRLPQLHSSKCLLVCAYYCAMASVYIRVALQL